MTKKDYEAIALLVAELSLFPKIADKILRGFMFYCESDNSRFDRDTFTAAIYLYKCKMIEQMDSATGITEGHSANA